VKIGAGSKQKEVEKKFDEAIKMLVKNTDINFLILNDIFFCKNRIICYFQMYNYLNKNIFHILFI
jgi:hypothetical protein